MSPPESATNTSQKEERLRLLVGKTPNCHAESVYLDAVYSHHRNVGDHTGTYRDAVNATGFARYNSGYTRFSASIFGRSLNTMYG